MAVVVSLINMKGGVGKTTIAAQLSHHAASLFGFRTLAVDLDPQANLSQALLGQYDYKRHLERELPTIDHVIRRYRPPTRRTKSPAMLPVQSAVVPVSGRIGKRLSLLPSQLELARTLKQTNVDQLALARSIAELSSEFDLVLIDCAPMESILTEVAYHASRYLVVPVRPEYLATIGLPLLQRSLAEFKAQSPRHAIEIAGIVINHSVNWSQRQKHRETRQSIEEIRAEAGSNNWRVFAAEIPYSQSVPKALRHGKPFYATPHVKQNGALLPQFQEFLREFLDTVGPISVRSQS